jgi:hypothetical protein
MSAPKRHSLRSLKTSLIFLLLACGHDNSPEGVAEEFLFRYFIELNQRGSLELSVGLAVEKLEKEIELLQSVRMEPNLDLSKHKPFIDYKLVNTQERDPDNVTLYYDVIIQRKSGDKTTRQQVLSATKVDGRWKINNFETFTKDVP